MNRLILSSGLAAAVLAAPALAQVYKWVDEKGVVNYSSEAPASRDSTVLDPKAVRVSTYSTEEAPKLAAGTLTTVGERALSEKIDRLERKLDAERYARSVSDAQAQAAADSTYQQCLRDRRVDCDYAGSDPYYYGPFYGTVVVGRPHMHPRPMPHGKVPAPKPAGRAAFAPARAAAARQM
ncbi:MAG TPA: DUF4124 domain-containing protein [Burkholderiales bacterium]|nr:DUF4124 domain-containing protein [Burkholderiales bacterium]